MTGVDRIWLVYVVLACESVVEVFFAPAEQAFLPRVVPDEDLVAANALNGQVRNLARLLGLRARRRRRGGRRDHRGRGRGRRHLPGRLPC